MKKIIVAFLLSASLFLTGCSELFAVLEIMEAIEGVAYDGEMLDNIEFSDYEIEYYNGYACLVGSDGMVFDGVVIPFIKFSEQGYTFTMDVVSNNQRYAVYGSYTMEESPDDENFSIITFVVDGGSYDDKLSEYIFVFDGSKDELISAQDIGDVAGESVYSWIGDEIDISDSTTEDSAAPPPDGGELNSPIPGDTEPVLKDIFRYMDTPREFVENVRGPITQNNPQTVSTILQDWYDSNLYDNYGRDARGLFTIHGYYFDDIDQVHQHVSMITRGAPDELYHAGMEFFEENEASGISIPYDIKLATKGVIQTGEDVDVIFYQGSSGNGGFNIDIPLIMYDAVRIEEAKNYGSVAQFAAQQSENFAVVDIDNGILMFYGTEDDSEGLYEKLTIVFVSTNDDYVSGSSSSVTVQMSGVQLMVHESGTRLVSTIDTENILEDVFDIK